MSFDNFWQLIEKHGGVADFYKADCARHWNSFSPQQQEAIYRSIRDKLQAGKFVHYNPLKAMIENAPKANSPRLMLSYEAYYAKYGTTEDREGWKRVFLPEKKKTIYVKE